MRNEFVVFSLISLLGIAALGWWVSPMFWWLYLVFLPLVLIGYYDMFQKKHAIMRNFPILGRGRYVMEEWRPKLYQYFIESDTNGRPISRIFRSVVYQRAKDDLDTTPFGTQLDVYDEGYEWMNHSIAALDAHDLPENPSVIIGSKQCKQPYRASLLNVSAMSYGSLSSAAIAALNGGAAIGGFAHNTGEGGISSHHEAFQGDLVWQIGTGYFGCRKDDGNFDPELFAQRAGTNNVKMIEIKLSQGAKPGHGGILPAKKVTPEIAEIRHVKLGKDVLSPPYHKAFNTPTGLLKFVQECRELSGGKPVGFKLCIGKKSEFLAICKAIVETDIYPDFIAVDGGEGGTGAAPLEFSNSVGMPYREGLAFAYDALVGFGIKDQIKIIASGKIITGFHILRALALGADLTYSARAMMLALGCIQALECNKNTCPTGVATQKPELVSGLIVADKKHRVANYQKETVKGFMELLAAAGKKDPKAIQRFDINRRVNINQTLTYEDVYPYLAANCLLKEETVPASWLKDWKRADPAKF